MTLVQTALQISLIIAGVFGLVAFIIFYTTNIHNYVYKSEDPLFNKSVDAIEAILADATELEHLNIALAHLNVLAELAIYQGDGNIVTALSARVNLKITELTSTYRK